jgi:hypothetical protein
MEDRRWGERKNLGLRIAECGLRRALWSAGTCYRLGGGDACSDGAAGGGGVPEARRKEMGYGRRDPIPRAQSRPVHFNISGGRIGDWS